MKVKILKFWIVLNTDLFLIVLFNRFYKFKQKSEDKMY